MSRISQMEPPLRTSSVPGVEIVARVRRLLVVGLLAAFGYSTFTFASKGKCLGGVSADGSYIDATGFATDTAPTCTSLTLRPSALVFVAIALIAFVALTMVLRRASDVSSALRYLDRAAAAIAILVIASVVISQVWFGMIPVAEWDGTGILLYPFPFGSVELETTPMLTHQEPPGDRSSTGR